jgi:hypothetical protein
MNKQRRRFGEGADLDILWYILHHVHMQDVMERINLNVQPDVRRRLKAMAARRGRTESEMARTLLTTALEAAWRDEFYRQVADAYGEKSRSRDLEVLRAFETLDG